jgi:hypothetical protein
MLLLTSLGQHPYDCYFPRRFVVVAVAVAVVVVVVVVVAVAVVVVVRILIMIAGVVVVIWDDNVISHLNHFYCCFTVL